MTAPFSDRTLTFVSIAAAFLCLVIGMAIFYSRYEYAEAGHGYLVIGYVVACFGLFFGIRLWNIPLGIIAIFLIIAIQIYSSNKFTWRENYVTLAQMGQPFPLNEFIDAFPSYEQYTFTFLKHPDWVRFNEQCVQPALAQQPTLPRCGSLELIQRYYNIDIQQAMVTHFNKMKYTAKQIEEGKMVRRSAYAECLASKNCVTIPLLPKGVDANQLDPTSRDHIGVRQAFWSLINDKKMSQEVCSLTPLCRALVNMKAVDPAKLPF